VIIVAHGSQIFFCVIESAGFHPQRNPKNAWRGLPRVLAIRQQIAEHWEMEVRRREK